MPIIKAILNGKHTYEADLKNKTLNGKPFDWDVSEVKKNIFHIIMDLKSYTMEVIETDYPKKFFSVKVNRTLYTIQVKDSFDELLHELGLDNASAPKADSLKAPMPGLVIEVMAGMGQKVRKGDSLLILEAMKMENVLKSPVDGEILKIYVKKGDKVEKNGVLINFQ